MFDLTVRHILPFSRGAPLPSFTPSSTSQQRKLILYFWDWVIQGKAKYNAWKKVADEGLTHQQAQEKYVKLVNSLKEKYGFEG